MSREKLEPILKERLKEALSYNKTSITRLAFDIDYTRPYLSRAFSAGKIARSVLLLIAENLDIHPDYLSGTIGKDVCEETIDDFRAFGNDHPEPYLTYKDYLSDKTAKTFVNLDKKGVDISLKDLIYSVLTSEYQCSVDDIETFILCEGLHLAKSVTAAIKGLYKKHMENSKTAGNTPDLSPLPDPPSDPA